MQCDRRNRGGTRLFNMGTHLVDHLNIKVGGTKGNMATIRLDQHIRQNRDRVTAFDNRLGLADSFEQGRALDRKFHSLVSNI